MVQFSHLCMTTRKSIALTIWTFVGRVMSLLFNMLTTLATWCKELSHWKRPYAGKDWRQEEKGLTEDEMFGCHHWLNGHEFEQAPGDGEGQGSLVCCSPWGPKELDTTEWLNNSSKPWYSGAHTTRVGGLQFQKNIKSFILKGATAHKDWFSLSSVSQTWVRVRIT